MRLGQAFISHNVESARKGVTRGLHLHARRACVLLAALSLAVLLARPQSPRTAQPSSKVVSAAPSAALTAVKNPSRGRGRFHADGRADLAVAIRLG